ncbi:MAG: bifunctional molybdenum cofactor biosynthesis protein MoaC/MoaB [Elusimicrobiota bacterium]|nr:bifunctional molybdenum cofactor biosynthesis protein MoaC/MoaB [Elusimicrobiota bacterium]
MINISGKYSTLRTATAAASVRMAPEFIRRIAENRIEKGNVLETARVAGTMAAKKTSELIPYCHPLPIDEIKIEFKLLEDKIEITSSASTIWKTGIEMEALTAGAVAALTIYDMVKSLDAGAVIEEIKLIEKRGGKSDFREKFSAPLKVCVLAVSNAAAAGKREDKAGAIVKEMLAGSQVEIAGYAVVADDAALIKARLLGWKKAGIDAVFTVGGTGLGATDVTVEALREVITTEAPGIAEAMRAYGQQRTPYSMFSRSVSGLIDKMLVVALPGSTRGVKESLSAILPGVFHAFPMMYGGGAWQERRAAKSKAQAGKGRKAC